MISGDALTDVDLGAVADAHRRSGSMATIVLYRAENPLEFGIVITREDGTIERFLEKPTWGQVFSDTVNTGIYVLEPEIFDFITTDGPSDFSQDVFPALLEKGIPIQGYVADGYWEDVGNLEAFAKAHRDVLDGRVDVEMPGFEIAPRVWIGPDCEIHPDATIDGPALVGAHCNVAAGAHVRDHTVLGDNVVVRADASLQRSIVFSSAFCDRAISLTGAIVGKGADLERASGQRRRARRRRDHRRTRHPQHGGQGLSLQERRGGSRREHVGRVGVACDPQPLRPSRCDGPRQHRHHASARGPPRHGLRIVADPRRAGHDVA